MDPLKVEDKRSEKANAISVNIQKIKTVFRFLELLIFIAILSRWSTRFTFSFNLYFRRFSVTLISPRFVFLFGNAIAVVLFIISGQFSAKNGEKVVGFDDEHMKKCRKNQQKNCEESEKPSDAFTYGVRYEEKRTRRCKSDNTERGALGKGSRRDFPRSMNESKNCGRKVVEVAGGGYAEDEMSSQEFRRTVEAFISRQQRFLREE